MRVYKLYNYKVFFYLKTDPSFANSTIVSSATSLTEFEIQQNFYSYYSSNVFVFGSFEEVTRPAAAIKITESDMQKIKGLMVHNLKKHKRKY